MLSWTRKKILENTIQKVNGKIESLFEILVNYLHLNLKTREETSIDSCV